MRFLMRWRGAPAFAKWRSQLHTQRRDAALHAACTTSLVVLQSVRTTRAIQWWARW
jgi:hypothetical protein